MPQGYYTIEQWKPPNWIPVEVLPFGLSLTAAEQALQRHGKPGFYRLVHTQRVIWCEQEGSHIRLRKSHASSPQSLKRMQEMFDRTAGRYPAKETQDDRRAAKRNLPTRKSRTK
jgi:hypothetical protein